MKKFIYSLLYTIVLTLMFYFLIFLLVREICLAVFITAFIAALNVYFTPLILFKIFNDESMIHLATLNASIAMTASIFSVIINLISEVVTKDQLLCVFIGGILTLIFIILIVRNAFKHLKIKKKNVIFVILGILIIGAGFSLIPLIIKFLKPNF